MGLLDKKIIKFFLLLIFIFSFNTKIFADENNCSKVYSSTKLKWLQNNLCNNGSDKLNLGQNTKIGSFYIFKILKLK